MGADGQVVIQEPAVGRQDDGRDHGLHPHFDIGDHGTILGQMKGHRGVVVDIDVGIIGRQVCLERSQAHLGDLGVRDEL